jgi:hypothetical protein
MASASLTATPKPTEHLTVDVEDPRTLTTTQLSGSIEEKCRGSARQRATAASL